MTLKVKVHKAYDGSPQATIALPKRVREALAREHGIEVRPGYAIQVVGRSGHCPRNLIVLRMHRDDELLGKDAVRLGGNARRRLGVDPGDHVELRPLQYEIWHHGTKAPQPLQSVVQGKWLVGGSNFGVWTSSSVDFARGFVSTGLLTLEIAWGDRLTIPLADEHREQLGVWCGEHGVDVDDLMAALPTQGIVFGTDPDNTTAYDWGAFLCSASPHASAFLRWARLYGHYFVPYPIARIFPGVTGETFKGNRLRIIRLADPSGSVLWERGGSATRATELQI